MTDEQTEKLIPALVPRLTTHIALLIARADDGDEGAAHELRWALEAYVEHPDLIVRYMARCAIRQAGLQ